MRRVATAGLMMAALIAGTAQSQVQGARVSLNDAALRALLIDSYVTPHGRGDDGPGEYFRANGVYQRGSGWGIVFEGRFEIRDGAVCVRGEASAPVCHRVVSNGDGTHTFINTVDGSYAVKTVITRRQGLPATFP